MNCVWFVHVCFCGIVPVLSIIYLLNITYSEKRNEAAVSFFLFFSIRTLRFCEMLTNSTSERISAKAKRKQADELVFRGG